MPRPDPDFDPLEVPPWESNGDERNERTQRTPSGTNGRQTFELQTQRLADVAPEAVTWLWTGYVARGKVNMLDGLPDLGKSTLALDIAARTTNGAPMPDGSLGQGPADVVLLTAEDGLADTVRPRFDAAGGDPSRVHVVQAVIVHAGAETSERWPDLRSDLAALEACVVDHGAALVIVDVLAAYIGTNTDMHRDQDIRSVMGPLAAMAERTDCAVVLLRHPTKAGNADPVLAGAMSIGIIGAARVGLLAGWDPDDSTEDPNQRRRLLAVAKCNIAAKAPTMAYRLVQSAGDLAAHVVWEGTTHHRAADLSAPSFRKDGDDPSVTAFVMDLLEHGPVLAADAVHACDLFGTTRQTALRHLKKRGGATVKLGGNIAGGPNRGWAWTLTPPLTDDEVADLSARYDATEGNTNPGRARTKRVTASPESVPFPDLEP